MLHESLKSLSEYCKNLDYKGWDIFDGLNAKVFKITPFYKSRFLRLVWIQFFKRAPINLRGITLVPKGYNAKGLALFASGLLQQGKVAESEVLYSQLKDMTCSGYAGISWGYNFDWESRAFFVPQGIPNLVTSVFVANSFLDYFEITNDLTALEQAKGGCEFLLSELLLFEDEKTLCFGYIPDKTARVHNANMLGATLLARVYSYTKNTLLLEKSQKSMTYAVNALKNDFSWPYGERNHHQFVDNFHTGFNLVALSDWMKYTQDFRWEPKLKKAYQYFLDTFWMEDGCPKYYNNSLYPIDIHCSAQGILTCLKLAEYNSNSISLANKIAEWAIQNMQSQDGFFYYQKTKWFTNKIAYIRWSQAWMFIALSTLLANHKDV